RTLASRSAPAGRDCRPRDARDLPSCASAWSPVRTCPGRNCGPTPRRTKGPIACASRRRLAVGGWGRGRSHSAWRRRRPAVRSRTVERSPACSPARKRRGSQRPDADRPFGMQPFEVLQIAVEERVLVIPLDLQSDDALRELAHVVDLVRSRFAWLAVDRLLDDEVRLLP